jgi:hypothetical protein
MEDTMTKEELRKKIADAFIEWFTRSGLPDGFQSDRLRDADGTFPLDAIGVTIEINEIERNDPGLHLPTPPADDMLILAVRTRVDGKTADEQIGQPKHAIESWQFVEVTPID